MDFSGKKLGFGFMRLPQKDGEIDLRETSRMVDLFMENGFCYFDTAHGYMGGKSENAIRECLTSRYPRESYVLADKLSGHHFGSEEEIRPLFESELEACGVEYFDYFLMHAQESTLYEKFKACRAYETAIALRDEGKIRHFGISFHDRAEVLEQILTEYPQVEVVQLQFNYLDFDDASVQAGLCYEVCRKHGKQVIVMEPVKGGRLAVLPEEAQAVLDALNRAQGTHCSNAGFALRFAAGFEGVMMVLSGMGNVDMIAENTAAMKDFRLMNEAELAAVREVCAIFRRKSMIACTSCRYCMEKCPKGIAIPELFACMNAKKLLNDNNAGYYYLNVSSQEGTRASDCIGCGACEALCPQHLPIRSLLKETAAEFEKKKD